MVKKDNSINVDVFQRVGNDVLKGVHAIDTDINEYINFSRPTINLRDIWLDSHQVSKLWNVNLSYIRTSMKQSPDKWPSHVWKKENNKYFVRYYHMEHLLGKPEYGFSDFDGDIISPYTYVQFTFLIETMGSQDIGVLNVLSKYANISNNSFQRVKLTPLTVPLSINDYRYSGSFYLKETDVYQMVNELHMFEDFDPNIILGDSMDKAISDLTCVSDSPKIMFYEFCPNKYKNMLINNLSIGMEVPVLIPKKHFVSVEFRRIMDIMYERRLIKIKTFFGHEWIPFKRIMNERKLTEIKTFLYHEWVPIKRTYDDDSVPWMDLDSSTKYKLTIEYENEILFNCTVDEMCSYSYFTNIVNTLSNLIGDDAIEIKMDLQNVSSVEEIVDVFEIYPNFNCKLTCLE